MGKVYDGSFLRIKVDGQNVFHETDASISMDMGTRERATKDTDGVETSPDLKSWSASGSALGVLEADGTAHSFEALFDKYDAQEIVEVEFTLGSKGAVGDTYFKGQGYVTSLELSGAVREDAQASWSITGTGTIKKEKLA